MKYKLDSEGEIGYLIPVKYKGKEYITGNRYHGLIELRRDGKLVHIVRMCKNHTFRTVT